MSATITQKQIAEYAGVTPVLVSRALNAHPSVSLRTRERIQEAARQLGYDADSNHGARAMAARRHGKRIRTDIIAVLMPQAFFAGVALPSVPFFAPFIAGIEEAAARRKQDVYLCTPHEGGLPRLIERQGVDGVICMGNAPAELETTGLPIVNFGGPSEWMTGLTPDNREGARLATRHLIELGHRKIACLAFSSSFWPGHRYVAAADRMDGYKDALIEAGLAVDDELIGGHFANPTAEAGAQGMTGMIETVGTDFTAVVCFNDMIAMGAIDVLRAAGRRVPDDVSVVGFDDVSEQYPFDPKLTSISFDRYAMGQRALDLICGARDGDSDAMKDEIFPVELAVRASTAPVTPEWARGSR